MFLEKQNIWKAAVLLGIGIGAMASTRETFVISLFCWTAAALPIIWRTHGLKPFFQHAWKPLIIAAAIAFFVIALFYTDGGRNLRGFTTFFRTFTDYKTGEGHDKPFFFYLHMLAAPKQTIGRWWCEGAILILALCTYLKKGIPRARFFSTAGLLHLLIYSLIAYKTPWLVCLAWLHLCIAAGYGSAQLIQYMRGYWNVIPTAGIICILALHTLQAKEAVRFEWDGRNPYAYVPTVKAVEKLPELIQALKTASPEQAPLAVIGEEYWPLPWYLRSTGPVGYWDTPPADAQHMPVLLLMPTLSPSVMEPFEQTHTIIPHGLRDNGPMLIVIRNDVWNIYSQ